MNPGQNLESAGPCGVGLLAAETQEPCGEWHGCTVSLHGWVWRPGLYGGDDVKTGVSEKRRGYRCLRRVDP